MKPRRQQPVNGKIRFSITLSAEVNERLEAYCRKQRRNKDPQVALIVEKFLDAEDEKTTPK